MVTERLFLLTRCSMKRLIRHGILAGCLLASGGCTRPSDAQLRADFQKAFGVPLPAGFSVTVSHKSVCTCLLFACSDLRAEDVVREVQATVSSAEEPLPKTARAPGRDWRPGEDEPEVAGDPRWEAVRIYRDASVVMQAYEYINTHPAERDQVKDLLLNDFQETIAARSILRSLDFLRRYPDADLIAALLHFQVEQTAGVWPPWKLLALRLFTEHEGAFAVFFRSLSYERKSKLIEDIRLGFAMSESNGPVIYPLPTEQRALLQQKINALEP